MEVEKSMTLSDEDSVNRENMTVKGVENKDSEGNNNSKISEENLAVEGVKGVESEGNDNSKENKGKRKLVMVTCGHEGCNLNLMEQNMKRHTRDKHGTRHIIVKPLKGQSTVSSFFTLKRKTEQNYEEEGITAKKKKCNEGEITEISSEVCEEENTVNDVNINTPATLEVKNDLTSDLFESLAAKIQDTVKKTIKEAFEDKDSKIEVVDNNKEVKEERTDKDIMREVRSTKEVCERFPEFEYFPSHKGKEFKCVVCETTFAYSADQEQDFYNKNFSQEFRNTKKQLLQHNESNTHRAQVKEDEVKATLWNKEEKRNKVVGLNLGRIVYHLVSKGRPDSDYTCLVYLSAAGGSDVGDINHSFHFVTKLLPHLAMAVRRRLKEMLGRRLEATGCLPPVNLIADKATHQRETRQFVGCITVNPGGQELLVPLLFGVPKCAGGSGEDLCTNILEASEPFTKAEQVRLTLVWMGKPRCYQTIPCKFHHLSNLWKTFKSIQQPCYNNLGSRIVVC